MTSTRSNQTLATTAFVLSICGLLAQPVLVTLLMALTKPIGIVKISTGLTYTIIIIGPLLGLTSVILAHIAMRRIKDNSLWKEMARATAGMIIGYASLAYAASGWLVGILFSYGMKEF